jgi:hypothetical protein
VVPRVEPFERIAAFVGRRALHGFKQHAAGAKVLLEALGGVIGAASMRDQTVGSVGCSSFTPRVQRAAWL